MATRPRTAIRRDHQSPEARRRNHRLAGDTPVGIDSLAAETNGWASEGERIRAKRQKQAEDLADLVADRQTADPAERIVLVGDFNAFEFNDGLGDSMNVIAGTPPPDAPVRSSLRGAHQ